MGKQDFRDCEFEIGLAVKFKDFVKEYKEKKKQAFFSYRSFKGSVRKIQH